MNNFTASNGMVISPDEDGDLRVLSPSGRNTLDQAPFLDGDDIEALREFFQAEADEHLGRWRWAQEPEFVAYWNPVLRHLTVVYEPAGGSTVFEPDSMRPEPLGGKPAAVARAYFDAHPEPKPEWHDASEGEVWELQTKAGTGAWFVNGNYFQSTETLTNIAKTDAGIISGRRIFPVVSS